MIMRLFTSKVYLGSEELMKLIRKYDPIAMKLTS